MPMGAAPWTELPLSLAVTWRTIFESVVGPSDVEGFCPNCHEATLHRWYSVREPVEREHRGVRFVSHGSLWEWCSSCHAFESFPDALVPEWGVPEYEVDHAALAYEPSAIEEARLAHRH
jgi:hypothetical protein